MKIILITPHIPPKIDGVGQYCFRLTQMLREKGQDAMLVTSTGEHAENLPDWVHAVVDSWSPEGVVKGLQSIDVKPDICFLQYVPHLYSRYGINFQIAKVPGKISNELGVPVAVTIHEHGGENKDSLRDCILAFFLRRQTKALIQGSRFVVTTCSRYVQELRKLKVEKPIYEIPVGANIDDAKSDDESLKLLRIKHKLGNEILLGIFGRLSEARNFPTAIRAIHFLKQRGIPAKLLMLGDVESSNPDLFTALSSLIEEFDLKEDVIVTGFLEETQVSRYLSLVDVLLFPQCDGLSTRNTSAMSALAHGLPIISYPAKPGNFDGYEIPCGKVAGTMSEDSFFNACYDWIKSNPRKHDTREENRIFFRENFSWDIIAQQTLECIEQNL